MKRFASYARCQKCRGRDRSAVSSPPVRPVAAPQFAGFARARLDDFEDLRLRVEAAGAYYLKPRSELRAQFLDLAAVLDALAAVAIEAVAGADGCVSAVVNVDR